MSEDPVRDALKAGFAALLRGDYAERDRQVDRARKIIDAQAALPSVDASPAQIVASLIKLVEAKLGRPLATNEKAAITYDPADFMRKWIAQSTTPQ